MVIQASSFVSRYLAGSSVADGATANSKPPRPPSPSRWRPSLAVVLSSRRFRLLVIPVVVILLVFSTLGLPSIPSARWPQSQRDPEGGGQLETASPDPGTWPDAPVDPLGTTIDWSRFAYIQYVTNSIYLCNSVMLLERLHHLGSRADRVVMYPSYMLDLAATKGSRSQSNDARLLLKARDEYGAILVPIKVQHRSGADSTWAESFTKLLAFNQTQYDRVLSLDSDSTVLQNMDELFLLPPCPVALPRAYWLHPEKKILGTHIMLLQPSKTEFERIMDAVNDAASSDYDMEIINSLYQDSALILPHRPYGLVTREYIRDPDDHVHYLGNDREEWDPVATFHEAKYLHFSDWPLPKPWLRMPEKALLEHQPRCHERNGVESCAEREVWHGFHRDFTERRKRVCETTS